MKNKKQIRFMSLYQPNHDAFIRFCEARSYGVLPAEDLVNETITRVYERLDKLKSDKAFLSFLFSTASNIIKNEIRRKKIIFYHENISVENPTTNHSESKLDIEVLYRALNQLKCEQKETLILFEISGYTIKEIADLHKCKESSVKQRLRRGRIRLAELLSEKEIHAESNERPSKILISLFF